jgi:hypothetical protein
MKQAILLWLVAIVIALGMPGCNDRRAPSASAPTPDGTVIADTPPGGLTTTGVLAAIQIRTAPLPLDGPVAVDSRSMKSIFPRRIGLLKQKSVVQETFSRDLQPEAMVKAQYESPLDGRMQITVTDFGRPPARIETRFGLTWLGVHIDRETDRGYERDGRQGPFRYYETFNRSGGFGQISVLWNNRLLIEIESYRLPEWHLLQALRAINWGQVFAPAGATALRLPATDSSSGSP